MPKSRNRKNHKAKVEQRNQRIRAVSNKIKREYQAALAAEIAADEAKQNEALVPQVEDAVVVGDDATPSVEPTN